MALGRVITLDALGTLLELEPPAPLLAAGLQARGVAVDEAQADQALRAEIAFYRSHHDTAVDAATLSVLRDRCTEILREALRQAGADSSALAHTELLDVLLAALRLRPYPEVPEALAEARAAGHALVVVSNWDVSLHEALRSAGLTGLVDAAICSAEAGAAKPDPRIFARARALVPGAGGAVVHVGDSVEHDVAGALAAGLRPVLVVRDGAPPPVPAGVVVIGSLAGLHAVCA